MNKIKELSGKILTHSEAKILELKLKVRRQV